MEASNTYLPIQEVTTEVIFTFCLEKCGLSTVSTKVMDVLSSAALLFATGFQPTYPTNQPNKQTNPINQPTNQSINQSNQIKPNQTKPSQPINQSNQIKPNQTKSNQTQPISPNQSKPNKTNKTHRLPIATTTGVSTSSWADVPCSEALRHSRPRAKPSRHLERPRGPTGRPGWPEKGWWIFQKISSEAEEGALGTGGHVWGSMFWARSPWNQILMPLGA